MADSLIGKKIGQYEVVALLGQGGMADVYRAYQPAMKREVAMKVLSQTLTRDPSFVERFDREVQMAASLEHAHIVPVYEHGSTPDGITYLTMRYIKGGTLTDLLKARGALPLERVNVILQQIAGALDYAHLRGIIHRDIKPSNVLIDEQGNAYLADFGLARTIEPSLARTLTEPGAMVGTPTYVSPEQIQMGQGDTRSDLYSLAVVLYEMVTGRPPFTGDSVFAIMQAHIFKAPPRPREFRPDLPPAIEAILHKALQKKPEDRYQTATELAQDFNAVVRGQAVTPLPAKTPTNAFTSSIVRAMQRQPRSRLLGIGAVIAMMLLLGITFIGPILQPPAPTATLGFASEQARPETGLPESLALSDQEISRARQRLEGSFIGIMACTLETEYHASLVRGARIRAEQLGLLVRIENARADRFRQPAIINKFVAEGAKAIIVCPLDEKTLAASIADAQNAGVAVISVGDMVYGKISSTFTVTNETMGRAVGEYAAEMINREMNGEANVIILDYPPVPVVKVRADAMAAVLREKAPKARLLGNFTGGLPDEGEKSMAEALKLHPDINVIMSINDAGAFGAVKALRAAGKMPDEVAIISVDAELEARRMIRDGEFFRASFDNDPAGTAVLMVNSAVKMLAGEIVPKQILIQGRMITREMLLSTPTPSATP